MADNAFLEVHRQDPAIKKLADDPKISVQDYHNFLLDLQGFPWDCEDLRKNISGMNPSVSLIETQPKVPKQMYNELDAKTQRTVDVLAEQGKKMAKVYAGLLEATESYHIFFGELSRKVDPDDHANERLYELCAAHLQCLKYSMAQQARCMAQLGEKMTAVVRKALDLTRKEPESYIPEDLQEDFEEYRKDKKRNKEIKAHVDTAARAMARAMANSSRGRGNSSRGGYYNSNYRGQGNGGRGRGNRGRGRGRGSTARGSSGAGTSASTI